MPKIYKQFTLLDAKAATGIGTPIDVRDYQKITVTVATASSANLTVKFQGALPAADEYSYPDFNAAQSVTNMWDYIEIIDLEDGAAIDGDVGIAPAGTDDFRIFQLNTEGLAYINAVVTARSAGSVTVKGMAFNNY